jgi:phosphopantetheinyl transferase (holo-ACP synthase)
MKKFVIIMFFVFLMIMLIAFNFILLDNQYKNQDLRKLENDIIEFNSNKASYQRQIDDLTDEKSTLEEENNTYKNQLNEAKTEVAGIIAEKEALQKVLDHKLNIFDKIKVSVEPSLFEDIVSEFIGYIQEEDYINAHNLIYTIKGDKSITLDKMKSKFNYKNGLYSINSFDIVLSDDKENIKGEIKFKLSVSVSYSKRENNENKDVKRDLICFITFDFDDFDSNWLIKEIEFVFAEE